MKVELLLFFSRLIELVSKRFKGRQEKKANFNFRAKNMKIQLNWRPRAREFEEEKKLVKKYEKRK